MAINPYVPATATGNGVQVDFTFTFPYIAQAHVKVTLNGVPTTAFTFFNSNILRFTVPPGLGVVVIITRETPGDEISNVIQPGGPLPVEGLNQNFRQSLYYNQETEYASANQSTAGLQAQITAATNTANNASANAGAAVLAAAAAQATADGFAASIATANSNASTAVTTADTATTTAAAAVVTADAATLAAATAAPPSMIAFVARNTAPPGWLKANGAAVSRTTYSALFGAIGTTFGVGNGSTTFNVPDLRGEFPRGWDDGRGIDSGRAIGSAQGHMFETHIHQLTGYAPTGSFAQTGASLALSNTGNFNTSAPQSGNFGAETRPRNIALLAIIKF